MELPFNDLAVTARSLVSAPAGGMVFDSFRGTIFFGSKEEGLGEQSGTFWSLNGTNWTDQGLGFTPSIWAPYLGAMVFDVHRRRGVYFGGDHGNLTASWDASPVIRGQTIK